MTIALVFAGGSGVRMGASEPKQFLEIRGVSVLVRTLSLFQRHSEVDEIWLVANPDFRERSERLARDGGITKLVRVVDGGETAQDSIYNGLKAIAAERPADTVVLIHDGVRPYVLPNVISACVASVREHGSAVTYTPCFETIVVSRDGVSVDEMPLRRESYTVQAPQGFRLGEVLSAHERMRRRPGRYADMVDQATIFHALGLPVWLVAGNRGNVKVTTPEDLCTLDALLAQAGELE